MIEANIDPAVEELRRAVEAKSRRNSSLTY